MAIIMEKDILNVPIVQNVLLAHILWEKTIFQKLYLME